MTDTTPDTAMPAEIAKLVERLRVPWPPDGSGDEVMLPVWVFELMNEAATALAVKDVVLTKAVQEIERLKNLVGDPEGTAAHAEAFLARAERAEAQLAEKDAELNNLRESMEELSLRLCDAEDALWRVFPNTHTLFFDHLLGKKTPDPFEGPGETYQAAYERMQSENEVLRKALEEIAAPATFFLSRKDAIRMRDIARDALKEGGRP